MMPQNRTMCLQGVSKKVFMKNFNFALLITLIHILNFFYEPVDL